MGSGPATKYVISLTANYDPATGSVAAPVTVKFPVLSRPADTASPVFPVAPRKVWTNQDWVLGWGQYRWKTPEKFWYGTVHSFRDGELSAGGTLVNPTTNIATTGHQIDKFAEYGTTRTLYCASNLWTGTIAGKLWNYGVMGTTETWTNIIAGFTGAGPISDIVELNNILYVCQKHTTPANYFTLTNTTWADGGSEAHHFALHPVGGTGTSASLLKSVHNVVSWGASWVNTVNVGGAEDDINALISFKGSLLALKSDGLYEIVWKNATDAIATAIQDFAMQRSSTTGTYWVIWNDRLWFNLGTSLAQFDGSVLSIVGYPWEVSPTKLNDICSIAAMDEVLVVGFSDYALAYHDHGVGMQGDWHYIAYASGRKFWGSWFTRIPIPNRLFFGLDDVAADENNTKYMAMQQGLFNPSTPAASSVWYSSWFDAGDQTVVKWPMQLYVEAANCDANNTVQMAYASDAVATFVNIGTAITSDAVTLRPATGFILDSSGNNLAIRKIQLRATIVSAGTVSPIIKSIELVYDPRPPDKRQFAMTLLCGTEWEVGNDNPKYTAKQYRDFLWAAAQQDTPIVYTDEYGDAYTVLATIIETPPLTEEGTVTGMYCKLNLREP